MLLVQGALGGLDDKESACNAGDVGLIPGLGRSPGEGNGNPLQYSCLENPMDRRAWWATVHGIAKSRTRLSDFTFTLFNLYAEYIMRNTGLDEAQAGIKIPGRNINKLRYADETTLMAESKELKSLLIKVKEESGKLGLKLNIQKTKIMASGPITPWQIDGETVETVTDFILGGSKITADGDCSHEIKMLTPWKKSYNQPRQHIQKQRRYFANKGPSRQSYGFSSGHVWM